MNLLLPFTAAKKLYISKEFAPHIALALQDLTGGRTTDVLPTLQNVLLEGFHPSEHDQEGIAQFISARGLSNHTATISVWDRYSLNAADKLIQYAEKLLGDHKVTMRCDDRILAEYQVIK